MRVQTDGAGGLRHLISLDGLTREAITAILDRAESYRRFPGQPAYEGRELAGVTLANLFFEPSTRTRASFDLASRRLGAHVLNLETGTSSRVKGETMLDTIYTLEAMNTDIFVIRDSEAGMPEFLIDHVAPHVSVISAGEAHVSHPTPGLLDVLTIRAHRRRFAGLARPRGRCALSVPRTCAWWRPNRCCRPKMNSRARCASLESRTVSPAPMW
jgi:aspartate carbamoyltransferase catalytic subunit